MRREPETLEPVNFLYNTNKMGLQLAIEVEVINKPDYDAAKAEYDKYIKLKDFHPVFLVFNKAPDKDTKKKTKSYFCSRYTSREFLEGYSNFKIIE